MNSSSRGAETPERAGSERISRSRSRSRTLTLYPYDTKVNYTNDLQYRACLRNICNAQSHHLVVAGTDDVDDITRDEWDFDQDAMSALLDVVYLHTREVPSFQELYLSAAGTLLSEDPEMGLAILFSYDYFALFHACLCDFFRELSQHPDQTPSEHTLPMVLLRQRFGI